jgi:hypothetical protein
MSLYCKGPGSLMQFHALNLVTLSQTLPEPISASPISDPSWPFHLQPNLSTQQGIPHEIHPNQFCGRSHKWNFIIFRMSGNGYEALEK